MTKTRRNQPASVARAELVEALQQLVDYLYDDECKDYALSEPDRQEGHVFPALQLLGRWLHEQTESADD